MAFPLQHNRRKHFRYDPNTLLLCHFDKSAGVTDFDGEDVASGGNAPHTVTGLGNAQYASSGKFTNCLSLDGAGDRVDFGASADWNLSTTFTLEFWIKATFSLMADGESWFLHRCVSDADNKWFTYLYRLTGEAAGTIRLRFGSLTGGVWDMYFYTPAFAVADDTWIHVAFVRNGTTWNIAFAGTDRVPGRTWLQGNTSSGTNQSSGTLYFGAGEDGSWPAKANFDEVRVCNTAKYLSFPFTPPAAPFSP